MRIRALLLCGLLSACGGAQEGSGGTDPSTGEETGAGQGSGEPAAATPEERDAQRIKEAQDVGCQGVCEKATECAAESARANESEEEAAKLTEPAVLAKNTAECVTECLASSMSVRQLEVVHKCLNAGGSCEQFFGCLDDAQKKN